jgi:hypothetical protein
VTGQYGAFTRWLSQHVLAQNPQLDAVRLGYETIVLEDGELRGTGTFAHPMIRQRERR